MYIFFKLGSFSETQKLRHIMVVKVEGDGDASGLLASVVIYGVLLLFQSCVVIHFLFTIRGRELVMLQLFLFITI